MIQPSEETSPLGPVRAGGRNTYLDLIRGVAVLGILVMNVVSFGLGPGPYFNLSAGGSKTWLDWVIGAFGEVFVDQKFMGLFSLLFGAGIALFCDRASAKTERPTRLSLWRNLLLLALIFHVSDTPTYIRPPQPHHCRVATFHPAGDPSA